MFDLKRFNEFMTACYEILGYVEVTSPYDGQSNWRVFLGTYTAQGENLITAIENTLMEMDRETRILLAEQMEVNDESVAME